MKIEKCKGVYEPEDDSYLMLSIPEVKGNILDVGCGTGIVGIHYLEKGNKVTFIDIDPRAAECTKRNLELNKLKGEVIISDLLSSVRGEFDYCLFNPPYLPSDQFNHIDLSGGIVGNETTTRFLIQAKEKCKVSYVIESSIAPIDWRNIESLCHEVVGKITYHLEEIRLIRVWRCQQ